jgi:hypothetical protein
MAIQKPTTRKSERFRRGVRIPKNSRVRPKIGLKEWEAAIGQLVTDIARWAEAQEWLVARERKELLETALGKYHATDLNVKLPGGWIVVEVKGRDVVGAEGRVDLYSWPGIRRMLLIRQNGKWIVKTDDGMTWPSPWNQKTFVEIAKQLVSNT